MADADVRQVSLLWLVEGLSYWVQRHFGLRPFGNRWWSMRFKTSNAFANGSGDVRKAASIKRCDVVCVVTVWEQHVIAVHSKCNRCNVQNCKHSEEHSRYTQVWCFNGLRFMVFNQSLCWPLPKGHDCPVVVGLHKLMCGLHDICGWKDRLDEIRHPK